MADTAAQYNSVTWRIGSLYIMRKCMNVLLWETYYIIDTIINSQPTTKWLKLPNNFYQCTTEIPNSAGVLVFWVVLFMNYNGSDSGNFVYSSVSVIYLELYMFYILFTQENFWSNKTAVSVIFTQKTVSLNQRNISLEYSQRKDFSESRKRFHGKIMYVNLHTLSV